MTWFEMKEQRRKNRGERHSKQRELFLAGHRIRSQGAFVITDKKTGETTVVAEHGCFGRLATVNGDAYEEWAAGTRGSSY